MKTIFRSALAALFAVALSILPIAPASAQFADQATWAGTAGGTANALTLTVPNYTVARAGIVLRFLPLSDNTGATTVNVSGLGAVNLQKPSNGGIIALAGGELRAGVMAEAAYDGTRYVLLNQLGQSTIPSTLATSTVAFGSPVNLSLAASVGSNQLTITMNAASGSAPTATNPTLIPFRDVTIAGGTPKVVAVTGALSFTINSGNTMGCVSGTMCRLWVIAICSSGLSCTNSPGTDTVGLCAYNATSGSPVTSVSGVSVAPFAEQALQTSASGTNGGSNAATLYCNISSVTARAATIVGYVEISEVTAGTWATGPTYVQIAGPGIKKPGDIVQIRQTVTNVVGTAGCGAMTNSPTVVITPTSAANVMRVMTAGTAGNNSGATGIHSMSIYRNATLLYPSPQLPWAWQVNAILRAAPVTMFINDRPNSTSPVTYSIYGCSGTGVLSYPGGDTGFQTTAVFEAVEIMG